MTSQPELANAATCRHHMAFAQRNARELIKAGWSISLAKGAIKRSARWRIKAQERGFKLP